PQHEIATRARANRARELRCFLCHQGEIPQYVEGSAKSRVNRLKIPQYFVAELCFLGDDCAAIR
ncbi:hypothetical protein NLM59_11710, partial [Weeksellaceae bacterium KMM 9724]|uniref:hypothetical protein n=1 Tax=Profundicola chukchiensis TaxID=2961959 RepID=UPI00243814BB